jgi:hypothetical protein
MTDTTGPKFSDATAGKTAEQRAAETIELLNQADTIVAGYDVLIAGLRQQVRDQAAKIGLDAGEIAAFDAVFARALQSKNQYMEAWMRNTAADGVDVGGGTGDGSGTGTGETGTGETGTGDGTGTTEGDGTGTGDGTADTTARSSRASRTR